MLVKGGHLRTETDCVDVFFDGSDFTDLSGPRFDTPHTHGGGDTLASAITAALASGVPLLVAVAFGKRYIEQAVRHAYPLGAGVGPVSALWAARPPALDSGH